MNNDAITNLNVNWDYTNHAEHYDKRADYSIEAIKNLIQLSGCNNKSKIADIGAGTGKLTKELLKLGLFVNSIEPNASMRKIGIKNFSNDQVSWSAGTGENTGLNTESMDAVFFGSSFNVVNQEKCLNEVNRILKPNGWFACMWNHRDLYDPIQKNIEDIIKSHISDYSYGKRREDPTEIIDNNNNFSSVKLIESKFRWPMNKKDIIIAWKSHATLRRQALNELIFNKIIDDIQKLLNEMSDIIEVPYETKIFAAKKEL